jgi:type VI protein secretion system component Hcp
VRAIHPSLTLAGQGKRYVLQDVTVGSCGGTAAGDDRPTEEVAFYYSKIAF